LSLLDLDLRQAPDAPREAATVAFVQTQAENAGAQEIARLLAHGAQAKGWRTRQIFLFRRTAAFDGEADVLYCAGSRPSSPISALKLFYSLYKAFRRDAPDVVVTFQHYGNLVAATLAKLAGVRLVIANQVSAPELVPSWARIADLWLGIFGVYDRIVVNSAATEAVYGAYPAAYKKRMVLIDHGFRDKSAKIGKEDARSRLGLPQAVALIGCAARLHPLKQLDLAIRVLSLLPDLHLALAGQGADRPRLESLSRELGVESRTHFVDELDDHGMGAFLAAIDGFVFPSAAESFGLAPIEAAQAGVPVVCNDLQVLRHGLAVDGEPCALFVDVRDIIAFAAAVRQILGDPSLAEKLSRSGSRLEQRFPLDNMVSAYINLFIQGKL
jgi:glycosyltransferase involved in cell wall biosynthesis